MGFVFLSRARNLSAVYQPVEKVGVWSNFRTDDVFSTGNVIRKLRPDPFLPLFQQAAMRDFVPTRRQGSTEDALSPDGGQEAVY